jgi:alcohol dehydrogenase class IV
MALSGTWNYPTPIRFGAGRISELPQACAELGITRPLLVTDPVLSTLPICASTVQVCADAGLAITVSDQCARNPTAVDVAAGVAAYRASGSDGVIAFGGGAAIDVAKAVALMVGQDRPLWDFEDVGDNWTRVLTERVAPCVAVPTTSGTGSEVGRASVLVDSATQTKKIIFHPSMLPGRVVADPALTVGLPAGITAAVGLDALSHNLEAWCAPGFHPQAEGIAAEGMRLIHRSLEDAVTNPTDLGARARMMCASLMGATAFQRGLGAMHAMAHPIGAVFDAHHGLINAVVMPYVLCRNRVAIEHRMIRLSAYIGLANPGFRAFLDWVLELRDTLDIPPTLAVLGVVESDCDRLAAMAVVDPSAGSNPIPLTEADYAELFRRAVVGVL